MTSTPTSKRQRRMAREPQTETTSAEAKSAAGDAPTSDGLVQPKKPNKTELVFSLLKRNDGATLDALVEATGWLPHSARAALTGLKKKGHAIERTKVDGVSRYSIVEPVSQ